MGPAPAADAVNPWLVNAGKQPVTLRPGGSFFHHADSFAMIRGGHIDLCVLGAFEVAENGDIANWATGENDSAPAVGGAMDLAAGAKRLWVVMDHATKDGRPKLVEHCSYPLTAPGVVARVYTNLAVIDVTPGRGFVVREIAPGLSLAELQARTGAALHTDA
jgi:3-oxoadipate CoA-transferase beta subunit